MGQWFANNIQILIFALFLLLSSMGWVFKQLQEQAEKKRAKQGRERAVQEALRTGRIDPTSMPSQSGRQSVSPVPVSSQSSAPTSAEEAKERLRRLAEQRRLEQQRSRQDRAGGRTPGTFGGPTQGPMVGQPTATSGRPGMPGRAGFPAPPPPPQYPQSPAGPRGPAQARPAPSRPGGPPPPPRMRQPPPPPPPPRSPYAGRDEAERSREVSRRTAAASTQANTTAQFQNEQRDAAARQAAARTQADTRRATATAQEQQRKAKDALRLASAPPAIAFSLSDRATLKRAILLNEILSKPVSLREEQPTLR